MTKPEFQQVDDVLKVGEDYMIGLRKRVNDTKAPVHKTATEKLAQFRKARALVKKEL